MNRFLPTKKSRPCSICGDTSGKCRDIKDSGNVLCMTHADQDAGVAGYRYLGLSSNGLWGKYVPSDRPGKSWQDIEEEKRQRRLARERRYKTNVANGKKALPVDERSRQFRALFKQLRLKPEDIQDLLRRGLTPEQIQAGLFRSVRPGGMWVEGVDLRLPGMRGDRLRVKHEGYLVPSRDVHGRITGCQIRVRNPKGDDPRYLWLRSRYSSHLPNGEMPIAVAKARETDEVWLVEGILKPYVASCRHRKTFIGASGGLFTSSPQQLREALAVLGCKVVTFAPDAGAVANPNVYHRDCRTIQLVQSWGYEVRVADWGQSYDEGKPDADEIASLDGVRFVSPEEYLALRKEPEPQRPKRNPSGKVIDKDEWHARFKTIPLIARLFQRQKQQDEKPKILAPVPQDEGRKPRRFPQGGRLQAIAESRAKYVLVSCGTGLGKTTSLGELLPDMVDAEQVIYLSNENPYNARDRVETLRDWEILVARHSGLHRDKHGKLRRVNPEKPVPYEKGPNCVRGGLMGVLAQKGRIASKEACLSCQKQDLCKLGWGQFNYLGERARILSSCERFIAHPLSLPPAADPKAIEPDEDTYDYSRVALVVDERILGNSHQIQASAGDFQQVYVAISEKAPDEFAKLRPFLSKLRQIIAGEIAPPDPLFGWAYHELAEELGSLVPDDLDWDAIEQVLSPDLSKILDWTTEYGVSIADIPGTKDKKRLAERDRALTQKAKQEILSQWLIPTLRVLKGEPGSLSLAHGKLTVTSVDERLVDICRAAKKVIFLDATGDIDELAALLRVDAGEIDWVEQEAPQGAELTITQVCDLGEMGQRRGKDQDRRSKALVDYVRAERDRVAVIRFKKKAEEADFHWFTDSRGSNDMQDCTTLVLDGKPCPNIEQLRAEYACLYRCTPPAKDDEDFQRYINRRIEDEVIQAIGRLRANRRPGEKLEVIILTDFPFTRFQTRKVRALEIAPGAGTRVERRKLAIINAARQLKAKGKKVTQTAVAPLVGCSQRQVSNYREFLNRLLEVLDKEKNNAKLLDFASGSSPPEETEAAKFMGAEYLPLAAQESLESLLRELASALESFPRRLWGVIFDSMPDSLQSQVIAALLATLPPELIEDLPDPPPPAQLEEVGYE